MDLGLKGRVALVTGAGRGIGRQICLTFAAEGAKVAINDFHLERANEVAGEITKNGGQAIGIKADITKYEDVDAMVKNIIAKWGRIDILCNNAGSWGTAGDENVAVAAQTFIAPFVKVDRSTWSKWIDISIYGVLNCTKAVLEHMVAQKYGKIVNTISDAGRVGEPNYAVYSAAKAGVVGFSKALAKEVARHSINVNCVSPGTTYTPGLSDVAGGLIQIDRDKMPAEQKEWEKTMYKQYPMGKGLGRLGLPSDLANMIAFLASDRSEWCTGQIISVSGGYTTLG
jgi:2-hydroxycyclohexanecarboxyl-CoA dehydrogenase